MPSMRPKRTFPSKSRRDLRARGAQERASSRAPNHPSGSPALTPRERDVVELLVGTGLSYKQIAAQLDLSEGTIRTHTERIYRAFGVHSRLELILAHRSLRAPRPDAA